MAEGKAYPLGEANEGRLKVSFFGTFYASYNILALDEQNQWSLVTGPDRDYLWILSRSPRLDPEIHQRLIETARGLDYPVEQLLDVEQGDACQVMNNRG